MRDRILRYLQDASQAMPADVILREVLNIHSPNTLAAEKVLRGILGDDPRFHAAGGLWQPFSPAEVAETNDFEDACFLCVEEGIASGPSTHLRGALYSNITGTLWEFDLSPSCPLPDVRSLRRLIRRAGTSLLVTWSRKEVHLWNGLLQAWHIETWRGHCLNLRMLAERVLALSPSKMSREQLATQLGMAAPAVDRPGRMARFLASCLPALLERVPEVHRTNCAALQEWIDAGRETLDFSRFAFGREYLRQLPATPGVYLMRNRAGDLIYVGKSLNLKRRVASYFVAKRSRDPKVARILERLHSLEVISTTSEVEALLLEMRIIRNFQPVINLQTDIHEQPESYGKKGNLILLVAEPEGTKAQVYFLREGIFVGQLSSRLAHPASSSLKRKVRTTYFARRRSRESIRPAWEKEIVYRWLSANRNRLNFVDVDGAGSCEDTIRQLESYLGDADRLLRKVCYR